jgi:hypothetical protein
MNKAPARLRPLNRPRPTRVDTNEDGAPTAIHISGRRLAVESALETWRIDDEWWRPQPISRLYWRLLLEDGRTIDVFRDLITGRWARQTY